MSENISVYGTERMCREHIANVHDEAMRKLDNTYQLNRLKENNRADIERREINMRADAQRERDRRALIDTQTRANIDTIRAQADADEKRGRVENERRRDEQAHELDMQKERDKFQIQIKDLDYQQEIKRKDADRETMRITRELDIKSKDHDEENRRKLIETEGKLKCETLQIENNFKKDIKTIDNKHIIDLKNLELEAEKMREEQRTKSKEADNQHEINKMNAQLLHIQEENRYKEENRRITIEENKARDNHTREME